MIPLFAGNPRIFVALAAEFAGWLAALMTELCAALTEHGFEASLLTAQAGHGQLPLGGNRPILVIDANCKAKFPPGLRRLSLMLDHPCYVFPQLEGVPVDTVLGWVDRSYPDLAKALGLPFQSLFVAHAGPHPKSAPMPMADRPIDLLFAGNFSENYDPERWRQAHPRVPALMAEILFDAALRISYERPEPFRAVVAAAADRGIDLQRSMPFATLRDVVVKAIEISEGRRRYATLAALAGAAGGLRLHVVANALPAALAELPGLTFHGPAPFDEVRRLMAQARIVLNATNKFFDGSHERVAFGMAEGAVLLTDRSRYLEADFTDRRTILFLPERDLGPAADEIAALARTPAALEAIAAAAMPIYAARHTWRARLGELLGRP